jgi:GMC oxidoreductase
VIDRNYLATDRDVTAILRAIEAARELGSRQAFDNLRESELIPGPKASAELRVHGILGLRVADASVMPQIITGPGTNASAQADAHA